MLLLAWPIVTPALCPYLFCDGLADGVTQALIFEESGHVVTMSVSDYERFSSWPFSATVRQCVCVCVRARSVTSVVSDSLPPYGLYPTVLLCPWDSPGKNRWSEVLCPLPGDTPKPGIEPVSPSLQADSLPLGHLVSSTVRQGSIKKLQGINWISSIVSSGIMV